MQTTPDAVIFDLGDTLLRQIAFDPLAGNDRLLQLAHPGHGMTPADIQEFASALDSQIARRTDGPELIFEFPCQSFQRMLFDTLGVTFTVDDARLEEEFWFASMQWEPADGVFDVLDLLRVRGIRACVLSNASFSGRLLQDTLRAHGMLEYFEFVLSSCEYGFRKPNPLFFNVALAKLGIAPSGAWMIGDKVAFDIEGARKSGLRPFWYNPSGIADPQAGDCEVLTHWSQLTQKIPNP
jgi:putative hydrolase of the HAD superfamily